MINLRPTTDRTVRRMLPDNRAQYVTRPEPVAPRWAAPAGDGWADSYADDAAWEQLWASAAAPGWVQPEGDGWAPIGA